MPESVAAVTVTIAMPVLNGGRDLALAVQSMLEQSLTQWELLILDDGSTDGATAALRTRDDRVRVLRDGQNRGLSARLNEAAGLARGRYFARMDHDDVSHPDRLQLQVQFLEQHPQIDLLGARCITIDERDHLLGGLPAPTSHEEICNRPWLGFYLAHPTWMGRTEWFRENPYRDPGPYRCEDQELLLRTYKRSRFAALSKALLAYRVRSRPRLTTLLRTRAALLREQVRYFSREGQPLACVMAVIAAAARVGADLTASSIGKILPRRRPAITQVHAWQAEWGVLIADLRLRSETPH